MAAVTRPYFIVLNGAPRMVEAPSPAAAVRHVVGAAVTELRPARGSEVSAWMREGKSVELYVAKPVLETLVDVADAHKGAEPAVFLPDDAADWLEERGAGGAGLKAFGSICREQRMTLTHFDELRAACPAFEIAILSCINGEDVADDNTWTIGIADVREQLEEQPMAIAVVIGAIALAKSWPLEGEKLGG